MVKISQRMRDLIKDDIVSALYGAPQALFANEIALEIRRDKEFVKQLLLELKGLNLVDEVTKSGKGIDYKERIRWRLKPSVLAAFDKG